jgi:hypothetical protein
VISTGASGVTIDFALMLPAVFGLFFLAMKIWPPAYGQTPPREPDFCQLFADAQRECAFRCRDDRRQQRLGRECGCIQAGIPPQSPECGPLRCVGPAFPESDQWQARLRDVCNN